MPSPLALAGRSSGFLKAILVLTAIAGTVQTAFAKDLALRGIMAELGANVGLIAEALAREDYAEVERLANAVADHPKVPVMERAKILGFLGRRMPEFKAHDDTVHASGKALAAAAARKDGHATVEAFGELQTRCLACHQDFRADFIDHFYSN